MTTIPNCRICNQPLTDNELDTEPGAEPSYFSAHHGCVSPTMDGRFVVVSYLDGVQRWSIVDVPGYEHNARAVEVAEGLAHSNGHRSEFRVFDTIDRVFTFRVRGLIGLRNPGEAA